MPRFHPSELPGFTLWLGPAIYNASNDYVDGEGIADWVNPAAAASDIWVQATAGNRPTFKQAQRWRFPAADFDGTSDRLEGGLFTNYVANNAGTLYLAFKPDTVSAQQYLLHATGNNFHLRITSGGLLQAANRSGGSLVTINFNIVGALKLGEWNIGIWRHFGAQVGVGLNGTRMFVVSSGATDAGSGDMRLGASNTGVDPFNGQVGEGFGYNVGHGELEIGKVLSWFSSRWQDRGDPHEQAREAASRRMVFLERPRKLVDGAVSLFGADFRPLQKVAVTSPLLAPPGAGGDGTQPWERRVLAVLERDIRYRDREVDLRLGDTREQAHTYRDSGVSTKIADPKGEGQHISGICMARNHFRASNAWVESDRGTVYQIGPNVEKVEGRGVLMERVATNGFFRSSFVSGTAGLTATLNGGTAVADTGTPKLFEVAVTANRGKLTTAGGATYWTWPNTPDTSPGVTGKVSIDYLNVGSDIMWWRFQRTVDNLFWNDSTGAWQAGSVDNALPLVVGSLGGASRFFSKRFSNTNAGNVQYILQVGFLQGTTSGRVGYIYHVQATSPKRYSRIVTDSALYTGQNEGLWLYDGEADARLWPNTAGGFTCRFTSAWDAADLASNDLATLVQVMHDDPGTPTHYAWLRYEPVAGRWEFIVRVGGTTTTAFHVHSPVRLTEYQLGAYWVGTGAADVGLAAGTIGLVLNGVRVGTSAVRASNPTETINSRLYYGYDANGAGAPDGWIRDFRVVPYVPTAEEFARWAA